jgi:hypothetical protein
MKSLWWFRLLALLVVVLVGGVSLLNLVVEVVRRPAPAFALADAKPPTEAQLDSASWVSHAAPFRTDLKADLALALAAQALLGEASYYQPEITGHAQDVARQTLIEAPHDSRIWLVSAMLKSQRNPADPGVADLLKMSYFTGPNSADIIPTRLQLVATGKLSADPDLKELARGDVRLILTRRPDLRNSLNAAYRRGSAEGKLFIEDSVKAIDPKFAMALHSATP